MSLRLLFITPKIDERHDDLAFASLWAQGFHDAGFDVTVLCGEKGESHLPFPVHALGHEPGKSSFRTFLRFQWMIMTLKYDRVFVHLGQKWIGAGAWWWWIKGIPTYLWYTHYTNPLSLKLGARVAKRLFCATKDSLPHYEGSVKKVVTGHGIDTGFWDQCVDVSEEEREPITHLLAVHRLSLSKRFDLVLRAFALLPSQYRLTHYGRPMDPRFDPTYQKELESLIQELGLQERVKLMGSIPMPELRKIYPRFRVFINLVPKTIDKTVLEAMYAGLTPVIIREHADAIGYPDAPKSDDPKMIADFIQNMTIRPRAELRTIVESRHSLTGLIEKMSAFMRDGI